MTRIANIMLLCLGFWAFTGCQSSQSGDQGTQAIPPQPAPVSPQVVPVDAQSNNNNLIVTPDSNSSGNVAMVNENARYVVINFPIGAVPPVGRSLNVYRNGLKVAELKVTGPQREFNTVADIVNGNCQAQDEVREN